MVQQNPDSRTQRVAELVERIRKADAEHGRWGGAGWAFLRIVADVEADDDPTATIAALMEAYEIVHPGDLS